MNGLDELLQHLARPEVSELAIMAGRPAFVRVQGEYQPVAEDDIGTGELVRMLAAAGGSQHIAALGETPTQWPWRVDGLGVVGVVVQLKDNVMRARFALVQREDAPALEVAAEPDPLDVDGSQEPMVLEGNTASWQPPPDALDPPPALVGLPVAAPAPARAAAPAPAPAAARPPQRPAPAPAPATPAPAPTAAGPARALEASAIDELVEGARSIRASDLHLIADRPPLFRIGGALTARGPRIDAASVEKIARAIIPPRLLATFEADGSCDFSMDGKRTGRMRVNASRQRTGVKICMRLIPKDVPTLASLGLPDSIAKATHHHQGLIVITGPTGHGKTSTLAAIVDLINSETSHHVITVEDPIEYVHARKKAMISQREVGSHTRSFANALKGSLREDPDVIVVGELRDTETVRMAISASETGHLLVGTMNTPSAAKTIDRLIDLFPPGDQAQVRITLAGSLRLVVGQRLVPDTDGKGLVVATEILPGSMALWSLIRDNRTYQIPSLQQRGKALGITRLDDSLAELIRAGKTTLENAVVFAENPDELTANITGVRAKPDGDAAPDAEAAPAKAGGLFGRGKA